jgi:hypothetical protein
MFAGAISAVLAVAILLDLRQRNVWCPKKDSIMNRPQPLFEFLWEPPPIAGRLIGMCSWRDELIFACEYKVYRGWFDPYTGRLGTQEITPAVPKGGTE